MKGYELKKKIMDTIDYTGGFINSFGHESELGYLKMALVSNIDSSRNYSKDLVKEYIDNAYFETMNICDFDF